MAKNSSDRWGTVPDIVAACARYRPDATVLADALGREMTAAALLEQARRGAHALSGTGVARGNFVAIDTASMSWIDVAVAYFSVTWLGAVAVLVMDEASDRVARERVRPVAAISGTRAGPAGAGQVSLADLTGPGGLAGPAAARPDDLLDIVFTSGTTGTPKPVASTHAQWADSVRPEMMISRARRVVGHTGIPVGVSGGLHGVLLSHLARGVTSLCGRTTAELLACCRGRRIQELHLTPHSARALARQTQPGEAWASHVAILRVIGGPVPALVAEQLAQRFPRARVVSLYGLTEGGASMLVKVVDPAADDTIGRPVAGTEICVLGPDGRELPPGEVGELVIRDAGKGPLAYYQDESLNRAWFPDGWARTGDMGFVTADGRIHLVGRDRELIVLRGGRIKPESVEEILSRRVPQEVEFAVVGLAAAGGWDQIAVFLAGDPDSAPVGQASRRLADMKGPFRPHVIRVVPQIPRGPFGKPLRRVLAEQLVGEQDRG
jgi:acyl-coenzyme A synthetase/AMP-(fatty) acid ligase